MSDIREAEFWLESARSLLNSPYEDSEKYTVAVAQAIHSIIKANIKANDALTMKFLGKRAIKHQDAIGLFLQLVTGNKIPAKFSDLRKTVLEPAIQTKSKADYKGLRSSKSDAEKWIRLAEKFLKSAQESLQD